jgi:SAM-dependent methyltransferase
MTTRQRSTTTAARRGKPSTYEKMYGEGRGWKYDYAREYKHLSRITDALGLRPGAAVLEIGCGEGFHSKLLYDLGFRVTGNEGTEAGVRSARQHFPMVNYVQGDSLGLVDILPHGHFDMVIARGHSWYHYRLSSDDPHKGVPANTRRMFDLIRPGGYFVLVIRTDFTGRQPAGEVWNNTRQAYIDLFSPLGEIVYVTDRLGRPIPDDQAARASGRGIVIATRKLGGVREGRGLPPGVHSGLGSAATVWRFVQGRLVRSLRRLSHARPHSR